MDEGRGDDPEPGLGRDLRQSTVESLLGGAGTPPGTLRGQAGPLGLGDQAMRGMTKRAREDLTKRATALFANQAKCVTEALPVPAPSADALREQLQACQKAATSLRTTPARDRRPAGRRVR